MQLKPALIIDTNKLEPRYINDITRMPNVWVKLKDTVMVSVHDQMRQVRTSCPAILDEKWYDTAARIIEKLKKLNQLPDKPAYATISGELHMGTLRAAITSRGDIGLIMTGLLSDRPVGYSEAANLTQRCFQFARMVGAQGITCPGYLLEYRPRDIPPDFVILATGIRSEGRPPGGHVHPVTPLYALSCGAYPVISEMADDENPVATVTNTLVHCGLAGYAS